MNSQMPGNRVGHYNGSVMHLGRLDGWRSVFTFKPDEFADAWTPFFWGLLCLIQVFPTVRSDMLIGTWGKCFWFWLFGIFWALFGYAGNWGVVWGFLSTLGVCPFFMFLAMFDETQEPKTQLNLHAILVRLKLAEDLDEPPQDPNYAYTCSEISLLFQALLSSLRR